MKPGLIAYLILGGIATVTSEVQPDLLSVGVPETWIALVQSVTGSVVRYLGMLGAAGILVLPQLRERLMRSDLPPTTGHL